MEPTVQIMLAEFLGAMGFETMARDVQTEQDRQQLRKYARIVLKNLPTDRRRLVMPRFAALNLV